MNLQMLLHDALINNTYDYDSMDKALDRTLHSSFSYLYYLQKAHVEYEELFRYSGESYSRDYEVVGHLYLDEMNFARFDIDYDIIRSTTREKFRRSEYYLRFNRFMDLVNNPDIFEKIPIVIIDDRVIWDYEVSITKDGMTFKLPYRWDFVYERYRNAKNMNDYVYIDHKIQVLIVDNVYYKRLGTKKYANNFFNDVIKNRDFFNYLTKKIKIPKSWLLSIDELPENHTGIMALTIHFPQDKTYTYKAPKEYILNKFISTENHELFDLITPEDVKIEIEEIEYEEKSIMMPKSFELGTNLIMLTEDENFYTAEVTDDIADAIWNNDGNIYLSFFFMNELHEHKFYNGKVSASGSNKDIIEWNLTSQKYDSKDFFINTLDPIRGKRDGVNSSYYNYLYRVAEQDDSVYNGIYLDVQNVEIEEKSIVTDDTIFDQYLLNRDAYGSNPGGTFGYGYKEDDAFADLFVLEQERKPIEDITGIRPGTRLYCLDKASGEYFVGELKVDTVGTMYVLYSKRRYEIDELTIYLHHALPYNMPIPVENLMIFKKKAKKDSFYLEKNTDMVELHYPNIYRIKDKSMKIGDEYKIYYFYHEGEDVRYNVIFDFYIKFIQDRFAPDPTEKIINDIFYGNADYGRWSRAKIDEFKEIFKAIYNYEYHIYRYGESDFLDRYLMDNPENTPIQYKDETLKEWIKWDPEALHQYVLEQNKVGTSFHLYTNQLDLSTRERYNADLECGYRVRRNMYLSDDHSLAVIRSEKCTLDGTVKYFLDDGSYYVIDGPSLQYVLAGKITEGKLKKLKEANPNYFRPTFINLGFSSTDYYMVPDDKLTYVDSATNITYRWDGSQFIEYTETRKFKDKRYVFAINNNKTDLNALLNIRVFVDGIMAIDTYQERHLYMDYLYIPADMVTDDSYIEIEVFPDYTFDTLLQFNSMDDSEVITLVEPDEAIFPTLADVYFEDDMSEFKTRLGKEFFDITVITNGKEPAYYETVREGFGDPLTEAEVKQRVAIGTLDVVTDGNMNKYYKDINGVTYRYEDGYYNPYKDVVYYYVLRNHVWTKYNLKGEVIRTGIDEFDLDRSKMTKGYTKLYLDTENVRSDDSKEVKFSRISMLKIKPKSNLVLGKRLRFRVSKTAQGLPITIDKEGYPFLQIPKKNFNFSQEYIRVFFNGRLLPPTKYKLYYAMESPRIMIYQWAYVGDLVYVDVTPYRYKEIYYNENFKTGTAGHTEDTDILEYNLTFDEEDLMEFLVKSEQYSPEKIAETLLTMNESQLQNFLVLLGESMKDVDNNKILYDIYGYVTHGRKYAVEIDDDFHKLTKILIDLRKYINKPFDIKYYDVYMNGRKLSSNNIFNITPWEFTMVNLKSQYHLTIYERERDWEWYGLDYTNKIYAFSVDDLFKASFPTTKEKNKMVDELIKKQKDYRLNIVPDEFTERKMDYDVGSPESIDMWVFYYYELIPRKYLNPDTLQPNNEVIRTNYETIYNNYRVTNLEQARDDYQASRVRDNVPVFMLDPDKVIAGNSGYFDKDGNYYKYNNTLRKYVLHTADGKIDYDNSLDEWGLQQKIQNNEVIEGNVMMSYSVGHLNEVSQDILNDSYSVNIPNMEDIT